ncbi:hypothetical protein BpHYR1_032027 [Brachionus plicatilis]|uniref:Uncharacterized protein n=1 Tax=Brachionus plicatilis TaxID=10195 RepID=A0A3M7T1S4_BRAPC|nr:hypothetical protein BpHYR1_032027 [Brachionus plicatilis]
MCHHFNVQCSELASAFRIEALGLKKFCQSIKNFDCQKLMSGYWKVPNEWILQLDEKIILLFNT